MQKYFWIITLAPILVAGTLPALCQPHELPVDIGNRRELFVDSTMIGAMKGTKLVLHRPVDQGPVLFFDQPWEGPFCGYVTVLLDQGIYRLYYRGLPSAGSDGSNREVTCMAHSVDGINWIKPELDLHFADSLGKNNIILADMAPITHNFSPFIDTHPNAAPNERYKALGGTSKGLYALASKDGIRWRKLNETPVFKEGLFDSQNVAFWSEHENRYLCYFRSWTGDGYRGFRTVSRTESEDFIHWSKPETMDFGHTPMEHLYTNQTAPYFRAPHIYLATAARFMPGRKAITDEQADRIGVNKKYFNDCSDAVLLSSRGGNRYNRTFMEGFIRPGIGHENWISRTNYPALNIVPTGKEELSIYVNQNYAQPSAHVRRYAIRVDGFVSVQAAYDGGAMTTRALIFEGRNLFLNFATSAAGSIRVEIRDTRGRPIPGFGLDDCQDIIGNDTDRKVTWRNDPNLEALNGQPVVLHFEMADADLYALQFR
jgi:hypothetical protein